MAATFRSSCSIRILKLRSMSIIASCLLNTAANNIAAPWVFSVLTSSFGVTVATDAGHELPVVLMYDSISRVYATASSIFLGGFCLTANANSGLSNDARYLSRESCSLAWSCKLGETLFQPVNAVCRLTPARFLLYYAFVSGTPLHKAPSCCRVEPLPQCCLRRIIASFGFVSNTSPCTLGLPCHTNL